MRRTKIICTLGPSTDKGDVLRQLMIAGMDVARLNFSHQTHKEQKVRADRVKQLREELRLPIALLLDTKGPEIRGRAWIGAGTVRTAAMAAEAVRAGAQFLLTPCADEEVLAYCQENQIPLLPAGLPERQTVRRPLPRRCLPGSGPCRSHGWSCPGTCRRGRNTA